MRKGTLIAGLSLAGGFLIGAAVTTVVIPLKTNPVQAKAEATTHASEDQQVLDVLLEQTAEAARALQVADIDERPGTIAQLRKIGEGHCGHFGRLLAARLAERGYQSTLVGVSGAVSGPTHLVVEVHKDGQVWTADPTYNVVYPYAVAELFANPDLAETWYGEPIESREWQRYTGRSFFGESATLKYRPDVMGLGDYLQPDAHLEVTGDWGRNVSHLNDRNWSSYTGIGSDEVKVSLRWENDQVLTAVMIASVVSREVYPDVVELHVLNDGQAVYKERFEEPLGQRGFVSFALADVQGDAVELHFEGVNRMGIREIAVRGMKGSEVMADESS